MKILKSRISAIAAASFAALVASTVGSAAGECGNHRVFAFKYNKATISNVVKSKFEVTKGAFCRSADDKAILYGVEGDVPELFIKTALDAHRAKDGAGELRGNLPVVEHQKSAAPVIAKKEPEPARVEIAGLNPFDHVVRAVQAVQNFVAPQAIAAPVAPQAVAATVVPQSLAAPKMAVAQGVKPVATPMAVAAKGAPATVKMARPLDLHPVRQAIRVAKRHIAKHAAKFVAVPTPPAKPVDLYAAKPVKGPGATAPVTTQDAPKTAPRFAPRPAIEMYDAHNTNMKSGHPQTAKAFGEVKSSPNRANSIGSYGATGKTVRAKTYVPA